APGCRVARRAACGEWSPSSAEPRTGRARAAHRRPRVPPRAQEASYLACVSPWSPPWRSIISSREMSIKILGREKGAILCFIIYVIPGLPKDIVCYLFGLSPMPFWLFAILSTIGRMPGTWALSAQGAKAAAGEYIELLLLTAVIVA